MSSQKCTCLLGVETGFHYKANSPMEIVMIRLGLDVSSIYIKTCDGGVPPSQKVIERRTGSGITILVGCNLP